MTGEYPIKPYKAPEKTGLLTSKITAKGGKTIEIVSNENTPHIVTLNIKSNRGTLKDTIEIPIEELAHLALISNFWNKKLPQGD